jgi:hypothetical protein
MKIGVLLENNMKKSEMEGIFYKFQLWMERIFLFEVEYWKNMKFSGKK